VRDLDVAPHLSLAAGYAGPPFTVRVALGPAGRRRSLEVCRSVLARARAGDAPAVAGDRIRASFRAMLSLETLRAAPKVLLHDHLDGGLRPTTIVELARDQKYGGLPTTDPGELARWFHASAASGSLSLYLRGFAHTIAVLQTVEAIERVAYECGEDLARDGIVYAEVRYAPVFSTQAGLNLEQVVDAVVRGFERAEGRYPITLRQIICAMRDRTDSLEMAELAIAFRERGVVGFDIAGEEAGHPPKAHLEAFQLCRRENFSITIHAGEAFGPPSIWQALQYCGAHRIGHGVRLIEDMAIVGQTVVKLGPLAAYMKDKRIPLELCPSSNVDTGAVPSLEEHPIRQLIEQRFRVTVNTDNRLMSDVTLSEEFRRLSRAFALTLDDVEKLTLNAMKSAFIGYDDRLAHIYGRIKPGFAKLRGEPALAGYRLPPSA
jgi:adenosine deaminase